MVIGYSSPDLLRSHQTEVCRNEAGKILTRGAAESLTSVSNKWNLLLRPPAVVAYCHEHGIAPTNLKP